MKLGLTVDDALVTTRAVRRRLDFDRPVEREVLEECLKIALQAPTARNEQGWQWIFVTDVARRRAVAEVYSSNYLAHRDQARTCEFADGDVRADRHDRVMDSVDHLSENMHRVPAMLIPCVPGDLDGAPLIHAASMWGSILPAMWSFMLAARERGLGTVWTTVHLADGGDKKVAEVLGIPSEYTQTGLIPVAYTVGTEFKSAPRLPIDGIVHWDAW